MDLAKNTKRMGIWWCAFSDGFVHSLTTHRTVEKNLVAVGNSSQKGNIKIITELPLPDHRDGELQILSFSVPLS